MSESFLFAMILPRMARIARIRAVRRRCPRSDTEFLSVKSVKSVDRVLWLRLAALCLNSGNSAPGSVRQGARSSSIARAAATPLPSTIHNSSALPAFLTPGIIPEVLASAQNKVQYSCSLIGLLAWRVLEGESGNWETGTTPSLCAFGAGRKQKAEVFCSCAFCVTYVTLPACHITANQDGLLLMFNPS
jgi:hypothetical protein